MQFDIGTKLKKLRKEKGFSILHLSEKAGVSTGQISQVERGLVTPSVVNLWKLSQVLGVSIDFFFEERKADGGEIIRAGDHRKISMNKGNDIYEILSPEGRDHQIDFMKIVLKPHGVQYKRKNTMIHDGEECGYVLSGMMTVKFNDVEYDLHEGDSIYFQSKISHVYVNKTDRECVSIWAMTPLFF